VTVVCAKAHGASHNKRAMKAARARDTKKFDVVFDF